MANISWTGNAAPVAQVQNYVFAGTWTIGDNITITIGTKSVVFTIASATIATLLGSLVTAYEALSQAAYPEFYEEQASSITTTFTLTAWQTAGRPFVATIATNSSGGTIDGGASSTGTGSPVSSGPYDVSSVGNWSSGALPASTLSPPVQSSAAAASGGSLTNSTAYYWVVTALNANGETTISNEETLTISSPNQTATLTWAAVPNATGYRIYRSTTSGTYGSTSLLTTISNGATVTHNDTGAATGAGQPPGSNAAIGDDVTIDLEGAQLLYGLNQSSITVHSRRIVAQNVTIGLPKTNTSGTSYNEYRPIYWQITATSDYLNTGSSQIQLDQGIGQTDYEQDASGSAQGNAPSVLLKGTNSANVWNFFGGSAALAWYAGETAYAYTLNVQQGATVTLGAGCTNQTLNNFGGTLTVNSAIGTALNHPGLANGTTTIEGSGAVAQVTLESGTCYYNTIGALGGNSVLGNSASLIFDQDQRPKTVTNPISVYAPSVTFSDDFGVIAGGYTLNYVNCSPGWCRPNVSVTVANL